MAMSITLWRCHGMGGRVVYKEKGGKRENEMEIETTSVHEDVMINFQRVNLQNEAVAVAAPLRRIWSNQIHKVLYSAQ